MSFGWRHCFSEKIHKQRQLARLTLNFRVMTYKADSVPTLISFIFFLIPYFYCV